MLLSTCVSIRGWVQSALVGLSLAALAPCHAAMVNLLPGGPTGSLALDTYFSVVYTDASSSGSLNLTLNGFGSLDGDNPYRDQFVMLRNGAPVFAGTFNMGGGGASSIDFDTWGATSSTTVNGSSDPFAVTFLGGSTQVTWLNVVLNQGDVLTLGYSSLGAPYYFGLESPGQEAWAVSSLAFEQTVPEPSTWTLAGLSAAMLAFARRRAKSRTA